MYDSKSMRRFWLLLLLLVLPIQMSWAAVHACQDGIAVGNPVQAAFDQQVQVAAEPGAAAAAEEESEQGGSSVHACDGLHELMDDSVQDLVEPSATTALSARQRVLRLSVIAAQLDRPQWPAA